MQRDPSKHNPNLALTPTPRVRKVLRIGHSYAVTIPGHWIRRNTTPDCLFVATAIALDGTFVIRPLPGPK